MSIAHNPWDDLKPEHGRGLLPLPPFKGPTNWGWCFAGIHGGGGGVAGGGVAGGAGRGAGVGAGGGGGDGGAAGGGNSGGGGAYIYQRCSHRTHVPPQAPGAILGPG